MSSPAGTTSAVLPVPRSPIASPVDSPVDTAPPRRRSRPPSQYWDVFEARWRTAPGVSCGEPGAG